MFWASSGNGIKALGRLCAFRDLCVYKGLQRAPLSQGFFLDGRAFRVFSHLCASACCLVRPSGVLIWIFVPLTCCGRWSVAVAWSQRRNSTRILHMQGKHPYLVCVGSPVFCVPLYSASGSGRTCCLLRATCSSTTTGSTLFVQDNGASAFNKGQ
jgi:hypothetical protein